MNIKHVIICLNIIIFHLGRLIGNVKFDIYNEYINISQPNYITFWCLVQYCHHGIQHFFQLVDSAHLNELFYQVVDVRMEQFPCSRIILYKVRHLTFFFQLVLIS